MKNIRITNGFATMSIAKLLQRAHAIAAAMTGNTNFPTPSPSLATLTASINALQEAANAAENGDRQLAAVRDHLAEELVNNLHLLGNYVLFTAAGDPLVATSSAFSINKDRVPRPPVTAPTEITLTGGTNKGQLLLKGKGAKSVRLYMHRLTAAPVTPQSQWQEIITSDSKHLFSGLVSGQEYVGSITVYGIKQEVAHSEVVSRVAL